MLRLRPSELTLTPDDVDETIRRIALRQTSRARQRYTMRPAGQPGRPILRRGPQRWIRDAVTTSSIAIPQRQQAVVNSVEEDEYAAVSDEEAPQLPARDSRRAAVLHSAHERNDATVSSPVALLSHPTQLPLRLRTALQALDARLASSGQAEGTTHTPANPLPRPVPPRNTENGNEPPTQLPVARSSVNTPELRGGGGPVSLARAHDVVQGTMHAPSPLNQMQRLGSPAQQPSLGDPAKPSHTPRSNKCSTQTPHSARCHGRKYLPGSEPRRSSGRQPAVTRSLSSGDAPLFSAASQSTSTTDPSNNVSITPAMTGTPSRHRRGSSNLYSEDDGRLDARKPSNAMKALRPSDHASPRLRERGSSATSASAAYSWYGSLGSDTQFPGSEQSPNDEACPQLDGVRANTPRLSPLPSMPYTRVQTDSTSSSPPSGHLRQTSGGYVAATTAVTHDLQSPLDPYVERYQCHQQAPHTLLNSATHANPSISSDVGFPMGRPSPDRDMPSDYHARLEPSADDGASHRQRRPEYHAYSSRDFSVMGEYPRLEQRSSENAPISTSVDQGDGTRHGQVQTQRAVYERLQNATQTTYSGPAGSIDRIPSRYNVPQVNTPHDVSNRARHGTAHDSASTDMPRQPSRGQTQHGAEYAEHPGPRIYHGASGGPRVQPRRDGPLSALASLEQGSGTTSRPAHSQLVRGAPTAATARTYRRMRAEQRDQENAGDEGVMRREEANIVARYGAEEQHRTMMNQTPPRIGRVERRMME